MMVKHLSAIILFLAFIVQTFSAPFIRIDYYFNQADYAQNCVNKARPKMHCNGQCQVMKKILAEEKKTQQQEERKMGSKVEVLSSGSSFAMIGSRLSLLVIIQHAACNNCNEIKMPRSFFHPPSV